MKNLVVALILIVAAGAGAVFFASSGAQRTAEDTAITSPLDADYDYYVQDMRATRFGSEGQPLSQLQAERVTHYPDGDRAELESPAFKSFGVDSEPWEVRAAAGTLSPDPERGEDRLELQGDVMLHKPLARGNFLDVRTSALTVFTDSEEAVNTVPVTLQTRNSRQQGVGVRALLAQDYIQLNNGSGTHDPKTLP